MAYSGQITLRALYRNLSMTAWVTNAPVVEIDTGWVKTARPRRSSLTDWMGGDAPSISVEFMLHDPLGTGEADNYVRALETMCGLTPYESSGEPELVRMSSEPPALIPHGKFRDPDKLWFIETLSFDEDTIEVDSNGQKVRTGGTMLLSEFVDDDRIKFKSSAKVHKKRKTDKKHGRKKSRKRQEPYTVKAGDTLSAIAAHKLGSASRWHEIAKLNKIRDPKSIPIGKVLKLP